MFHAPRHGDMPIWDAQGTILCCVCAQFVHCHGNGRRRARLEMQGRALDVKPLLAGCVEFHRARNNVAQIRSGPVGLCKHVMSAGKAPQSRTEGLMSLLESSVARERLRCDRLNDC